MASPSDWIHHVHAFIDLNLSQDQHDASLERIIALIKGDMLTLETLVKEMEVYLTTTDAVTRARGILLLAQVLTNLVSKPVAAGAVHSLIEFFMSRLADWQALHGALIGSLALIRRNDSVGMVSMNDARDLAQSFLENLQVQALAQEDRKLCFELLECLLSVYPDALSPLGDNLVYGVCEAIDEEKDPWCLLHCFHIVELLVDLFPNPCGHVASFAKDIFEILSRYFPIYFTHAKDDIFDMKREDLSRALMHALSSTSLFEPFCIPLLLEKLASSLRIAKLDALKYLSHCVIRYGPDRMSKHAKAIWLSLKDIIFTLSSSREPITSSTLELLENPSKENEVMKEALICWANCILVCDGSNEVFLSLLVQDDDLVMIFSSISRDYCLEHMSTESKKRLNAFGSLISASAKVSAKCCTRVFERFFPRLMDVLGISTRGIPLDLHPDGNNSVSIKLNSGALFLCIELLSVSRLLASQEVSSQCVPLQNGWFHLLQNFAEPFILGLRFALSSAEGTATENHAIEGTDGIYVVKCLQILATFPGCCSPMSEEVFQQILRNFILVITDRCTETVLWKHSLKALVQIGISIEKFGDSEKCISYKCVVVEGLLSWLLHDDSSVPLSVKLEVLCDAGTAGINFAMRTVGGLKEFLFSNLTEALVNGNQSCAKIATRVLGCLSSQLLPWLQEKRCNDEICLLFSDSFWLCLNAVPEISLGLQGNGLFDALMVMMRLVVSYCTEEHQALIVQKGYRVLMAKTFLYKVLDTSASMETIRLPPTGNFLSLNDKWLVSLLASVIIALRPHVLLPDVRNILKTFTVSVLAGLEAAAQALGSMVNKWPVAWKTDCVDACTLEEGLDFIFEIIFHNGSWNSQMEKCVSLASIQKNIRHFDIEGEFLVGAHAIVGVAWLAKGLVMRGHEKAKDMAMLLLDCLLSRVKGLTLETGNDSIEDKSFATSMCAADAFQIITSDSEISLNKTFHACIRPLYKQRFYLNMMPLISQAIREHDYSVAKSVLYRALGHVICNAPLATVLSESAKIIPLLLDGLHILSEDETSKNLIYSLLLILSGILMDENGKEAVLENVPPIVNNLVRLVTFPHMMIVRETAIQCLIAISGLPQATIYPYVGQVLKAIKRTLDDRKRSVRQEAVRCHQAWASIASRALGA